MKLLRDQSSCPRPPEGSAVTIGAYDGVHLGHQAVIAEVRRRAEARGLRSAVVTFDRHPASVVRPESAPKLLTDLDQKLDLLAATGIDYGLVVTFDEERSRESADDFVRDVLVACLNAKVVVVGEDFHFGHNRTGNVARLVQLGHELGFDVEGIDLVGPAGGPAHPADQVSSTRIRRALAAGAVDEANGLLGRPYEVRGRSGPDGVAVPPDILVPAVGAYAGWREDGDGTVHPAVLQVPPAVAVPWAVHTDLLDGRGDTDPSSSTVEPAPEVRLRFVARLVGEDRHDEARRILDKP